MPSLKAFRKMSGLPDSIRRWSQAAEQVKAGQQALVEQARGTNTNPLGEDVADNPHHGTNQAAARTARPHPWATGVTAGETEVGRGQRTMSPPRAPNTESKPMDVSKWPVSNVTLGHFPKARSDVVLLALCDMPADTPVVNQYDQDGRKLPDPRGPALLMTMFHLVAIYHNNEKVAETVGGLHEGKSRGGFSQSDLAPLWSLLDTNDVVTVRVVARPRSRTS